MAVPVDHSTANTLTFVLATLPHNEAELMAKDFPISHDFNYLNKNRSLSVKAWTETVTDDLSQVKISLGV